MLVEFNIIKKCEYIMIMMCITYLRLYCLGDLHEINAILFSIS